MIKRTITTVAILAACFAQEGEKTITKHVDVFVAKDVVGGHLKPGAKVQVVEIRGDKAKVSFDGLFCGLFGIVDAAALGDGEVKPAAESADERVAKTAGEITGLKFEDSLDNTLVTKTECVVQYHRPRGVPAWFQVYLLMENPDSTRHVRHFRIHPGARVEIALPPQQKYTKSFSFKKVGKAKLVAWKVELMTRSELLDSNEKKPTDDILDWWTKRQIGTREYWPNKPR